MPITYDDSTTAPPKRGKIVYDSPPPVDAPAVSSPSLVDKAKSFMMDNAESVGRAAGSALGPLGSELGGAIGRLAKTHPELVKIVYDLAHIVPNKLVPTINKQIDKIPDLESESAPLNFAASLPKEAAKTLVEAGGAMATPEGVLSDAIPVERILAAAAKGPAVESAMAKGSQMMTAVGKQNFKRVFNDPAAILPEFLGGPPSRQAAGEALAATEAKSLPRAAATAEEIMDPQVATGRDNAMQAMHVLDTYKRISQGDPAALAKYIQDPEVGATLLKGTRGIDRVIEATPQKFRQPLFAKRAEISQILKDNYPELKDALETSSRSIARDETTKLLPVLKSGDPSVMRTFMAAAGRTMGAPLGVSLPIVHAIATAGAGLSAKALENLLNVPSMRASVIAALMKMQGGSDAPGS